AYKASLADPNAKLSSANNPVSASNTGPKRSEAKDIPPIAPQQRAANKPGIGLEETSRSQRKRWFAQEFERLSNEFGAMTPLMLSSLQTRDASGRFGLVKVFRGCWLERGIGQRPTIVTRSKKRADLILQAQGNWLFQFWPDLTVRHAKVDEL